MKGNGRLFAVLTLLSCLWAPVNLVVDWAFSKGFSPLGVGLVRWTGVAIVFGVLTRVPYVRKWLKLKSPTRRDFALSILLGLLLTGPAHLFYYIALQHTQSVEGTVFNTTAPLWTALFAGLILREHVGPRRWLALAIGTVGAYVTAVGFALPSLHAGHAGQNALYLVGTLMESVTGVILAGLVRRSSGITVFGAESIGMATAFVVSALVVPAAAPLRVPMVGLAWLPLLYLIFIAGAFAFGTWATLVERAPLSMMVISLAVQPPMAAIAAYLARGERVSSNVVLGAAFVAVALIIEVYEPLADRGLGVSLPTSSLGGEMPAD